MATLADLVAVQLNPTGTPYVELTFPTGTMNTTVENIRQTPSIVARDLRLLGFLLDRNVGETSMTQNVSLCERIMEQINAAPVPLPPLPLAAIVTGSGTTTVPAEGSLTGVFPQGTVVHIRLTVDTFVDPWAFRYHAPRQMTASEVASDIQGVVGWIDVADVAVITDDLTASLTFLAINAGTTLTLDTWELNT